MKGKGNHFSDPTPCQRDSKLMPYNKLGFTIEFCDDDTIVETQQRSQFNEGRVLVSATMYRL
jgi:hypothetical protein